MAAATESIIADMSHAVRDHNTRYLRPIHKKMVGKIGWIAVSVLKTDRKPIHQAGRVYLTQVVASVKGI